MSGGGLMGRPADDGRFGEYGGRFVPESLMPACLELEKWFDDAWADAAFRAELDGLLHHYGGRPTPVTECARLSKRLGVRVLLKREDLAHTGSHKLNNVVGQALLTTRMGKARHDRGDRRGAARCGRRHGRGALRVGVHRLYG